MVKRKSYTLEAGRSRRDEGSNPSQGTNKKQIKGLVAQWLEQPAHNWLVVGSNPTGAT